MAGFNTAVTGLKAATTDLDVIGNNIANASTVGFKSSRAEFADIYATAVVGAGSANVAGSGVTVSDIAQDFQAGTIEFTNNNLDLAINGSGFFQLDDGQGGITYTRNGSFELDKNGNIVSKSGSYLQGYGLDAEGNQLPVGPLAVTEKESPPKATENIDLAFNINSSADAGELQLPYDRENPQSFTFTTTVGTFDSLGNQHSIKYNFAEQKAVREGFSFQVEGSDTAGSDVLFISGIAFNKADIEEDLNNGINPFSLDGEKGQALAAADPRIDLNSFKFETEPHTGGAPNPDSLTRVSFELKAKHSFDGNIVFGEGTVAGGTASAGNGLVLGGTINSTPLEVDEAYLQSIGYTKAEGDGLYRPANETHTYQLNTGNFTGTNNTLPQDLVLSIGGVEVRLTAGSTPEDVTRSIVAQQSAITDANPDVESVTFNSADATVKVTWRADAGDVQPLEVTNPAIDTDSDGTPEARLFALPDGQTFAAGPTQDPGVTTVEGDNSYQGVYRMFAYLNDTQQLNLGKSIDPGEPDSLGNGTEVGSILIEFDPTSGTLSGVNGQEITVEGASAPLITVYGADPANPQSATNEEFAIDLDLTGSTQFSSDSIVKASTQDGYTKGDLVGVSFAGTGEMVASYSNGQRQDLGLVAIATFENQNGLIPSGDTEWSASLNSGDAILNPPGTGLNGTLRSAALEQSNVDLSAELVKLIEAQRNFQANSKTLETLNTVTQNILQI